MPLVETGVLVAEIDDATLIRLSQPAAGAAWVTSPAQLVDAPGLDVVVRVAPEPDGQLLLAVDLTNPAAVEVTRDVVFPRLLGVGGVDPGPLAYMFPALGAIADDQITTHERTYSSLFPMQWMEVHEGEAGLWVATRDPEGRDKLFRLIKDYDDRADLTVTWDDLTLAPGQTVTLEAVVGAHESDWHEALDAYGRWVDATLAPTSPRSRAFREAFNLRQIHLHDNVVLGAHPGAFDPATGYAIDDFLAEDAAAFGGVDWVHVFDWGTDDVYGRVGDYVPWSDLGDPADFAAELDALEAQGIGTGLYLEGYLLDPESLTATWYGPAWEMLDDYLSPYGNWWPAVHVCPGDAERRDLFAELSIARTDEKLAPSGFYIDQFGFGYQYPCYRTDHAHAYPSGQIQEEMGFLDALRAAVPPDRVFYGEAAPADVQRMRQDGAFTEAVASFRDDPRTVPVSLARFAFPDFKTFELLIQDGPLGEDVEGVRLTFFNGEGDRLMGYLADDDWFGDLALAEIAHAWSVQRAHLAAFTSDRPVPLVPTRADSVYANLFPTDDEDLWTLYNAGPADVSGVVLAVPSLPGEAWTDCWDGVPLAPAIVGGEARIALELAAGDVGCLVRTRPADPATLVAHWTLDELAGAVATEVVGGSDGAFPAGAALGAAAASPRLGTAVRLDGADGIALGEVPALAGLTASFSVAAWVDPDAMGELGRILAVEGFADGGFVFGLGDDGGRPALVLTTVGVHDYVQPAVVAPGRWTHVAVVVDAGSTATFYVDGHARGSVPFASPGSPATGPWWLGSNGLDGAFAGGLDDVRVYDGALTPDEVEALADVIPPTSGQVRAAGGVVARATDLELWWTSFHDAGAGIVDHTVRLGTTEGGDDLLSATSAGTATSIVLSGLWLPDGEIWATVAAADGVGLVTEVSAPLVVDATGPALLGAWSEPTELGPELALADRFTVTAWITPAGPGPATIVGADQGGWSFGLGGDGDDLVLALPGLADHVVPAALVAGERHHVAVTVDRWCDARFYVDGVEIGVGWGTLPARPAEGSVWVGGSATPWAGALEDVRLYDDALAADEIAALASPDDPPGTTEPTTPGATTPDGDVPDAVAVAEPGGCGCASPAGASGSLAWVAAALLARRRSWIAPTRG